MDTGFRYSPPPRINEILKLSLEDGALLLPQTALLMIAITIKITMIGKYIPISNILESHQHKKAILGKGLDTDREKIIEYRESKGIIFIAKRFIL